MANMFPVTPAPPQDNNRQQAHRLAVRITTGTGVPSPRMSAATPAQLKRGQEFNLAPNNGTYFTPRQNRIANSMGRHNNPLGFLGNKAENFLQLKQIGQEAVHSFDPRTRAGLVNVLSLFAGGPKDTFGRDEFLMSAGHQPYSAVKAYEGGQLRGADLPNVVNRRVEGNGTGIRGLVRRAQGVGGYRQANPMDVIEGQRAALSKRLQELDKNKEAVNGMGRGSKIARDYANNTAKVEKAMGGAFVPMMGRFNPDFPTGSMEGVKPGYMRALSSARGGQGSSNPLDILANAKSRGFDPNHPAIKLGGEQLGNAAAALDKLLNHSDIHPEYHPAVENFVNSVHNLLGEGHYAMADKLLRSALGSGQWGRGEAFADLSRARDAVSQLLKPIEGYPQALQGGNPALDVIREMLFKGLPYKAP